MSNKFSFLITVDDKGKVSGKAFRRVDTQAGLEEYSKAREEGKECHFYQHPVADKRCKSALGYKQLEDATSQVPDSVEPAV